MNSIMCSIRTLQVLVILITVSWNSAQHEADHTPAIGIKGTKCYDDFNRPQGSDCHGNTNFVVKRFENCDPFKTYPLHFNATIKTIENKQYADGEDIFAIDLDNSIRSNFSIEILNGKRYRYLFSITERRLCAALHKYLGEFIYEMERSAQLMPKTCPILKGTHRVHNFELNFEKITLQTFPFGRLRFTELAYDKQNNEVACLIIEVDNRE